MADIKKADRLNAIKELIRPFCDQHLNDELTGYVMKLYDKLSRKRTISITRGRPEIWAAAIVYVIARLNFLFDKNNPFFITVDTICEFFDTKKSTVGSKAALIEEACNIGIGEKGLCSPRISDMFTFYQTPEGFILPKTMLPKNKIEIAFMDEDETREFEARLAEQERRREKEAEVNRARREEIRRETAAKTRKEKYKDQTDLFGDNGT